VDDRRRARVGWYFYDFANSAFSTTVITVFLGPHLTAVTRAAADAEGFVHPLGLSLHAGSFFPYVVSLSVALQALVLPSLGAMADHSRRKKQMLGVFAYLGACTTMALYFVRAPDYVLGGVLCVIANLSFGASVVFYNALLADVAAPDERDAVSSRGWALGYLGGGLLLAMNFGLVSRAPALGLTGDQATRISLASAGLWWALFTLVPMLTLRSTEPATPLPPHARSLTAGFTQLALTVRSLRKQPRTLLFLVAYLLYNDGIQTVVTLSSQFGHEELGLSMATLAGVILMVQFVALLGSLAFEQVARVSGAKGAIIIALLGWTGALVYVYALLRTPGEFVGLAVVIALVLGGSQALSRSLYSLMIPHGYEARYFSLYEVSDRGTSWLGPLVFGLSLQFSGSYRVALLSLVVFFAAGLLLLARVDVRRAIAEATNPANVP
jgi:UMF1 family MFS transporter